MEEAIDYQKIYDDTFNQQRDTWLDKLKSSFDTDDGLSAEAKFWTFRDEILTEHNALQTSINGTSDSYFQKLVADFELRERTYKRDHIQLFFEREFPTIQNHYLSYFKNSKLLNDKYNKENTLVYIAKFLAIKELHNRCIKIDPNREDTEQSILKRLTNPQQEIVLDAGSPPITPTNPYYWAHEQSFLQMLYDLLLKEGLIKENENFITSFTKQHPPKEQITVWIGSQVQLVYLFYLLYPIVFKNERIFEIIPRLFLNKRKNTEFIKKNLNTTYTKNQDLFSSESRKLSDSVRSIKKIVKQLNLPEKAKS